MERGAITEIKAYSTSSKQKGKVFVPQRDFYSLTYRYSGKILVEAKMKEYILNTTTKMVIRGSDKKLYDKKIVMTFSKRNLHAKEGFVTNCPNCNAESTQVEFGKCKYCDTLVFPIRYNWTLVKFETI